MQRVIHGTDQEVRELAEILDKVIGDNNGQN